MTVTLLCPVWACGAGKFSPDPVTMETGYIGHGEAFYPNSIELDLDRQLVFFSFITTNALRMRRTQR